jgi:NAD(P)-dependent dehydrogenase (short-subunit alcohol dehydrogenase family)
MELGLSEKVALVTGANRGRGPQLLQNLPEGGCIFDWWRATRTDDLGSPTVSVAPVIADGVCRTGNIRVHVVWADRREPAAPEEAIAQAVAQFGWVDMLVDDAGGTTRADFFRRP